jgi:polar amino acid transport system substrate-binding protein
MRSPVASLVRLGLVALLVVLSASAIRLVAHADSPAPLRFVSTAWTPFTNPPGQPRFALDLTDAALARAGLSAKTTIVSAAQFTPSLESGLFDGSAAVWKDPERERTLLFSQPYLENRLVLVGRHGADVSATSISALTGKRIAIVDGYSYGDAVGAANAAWVRSRGEEDSVTQLLKGAVDYTLMDELVVSYIEKNYPEQSAAKLQIGSIPIVTRPLYLAVNRSRIDAQSIVDRFNAQLRGMITDRTYHKLLHVDWIAANIDGTMQYVAASDQIGTSAPNHPYVLLSDSQPTLGTEVRPGFYVGGNIYADWASVPDNFKTESVTGKPDPRRSTASIFKFTW